MGKISQKDRVLAKLATTFVIMDILGNKKLCDFIKRVYFVIVYDVKVT